MTSRTFPNVLASHTAQEGRAVRMAVRLYPSTVILAFTTGYVASAILTTTLKIREQSRVELSCDPDFSVPVSRVTWYWVKTSYIPEFPPPSGDYVKVSEWHISSIYHKLNKFGYRDYKYGGKFTLIVKSVTSTRNQEIFCCFVNNMSGRCFRIDVIVPVERVVLGESRPRTKGPGRVLDVRAGNDSLITCLAPRANPAPDFFWSLSGRPLVPLTMVQNDPNSVTISLQVDRAMAGETITCTAKNVDGISKEHRASDTASLNVLFPPSRPVLTIEPAHPAEGSKTVLSCLSEGNPIPSLSLLTPGGMTRNQTADDETYGNYRFSPITRRERGKYECRASNSQGRTIHFIHLDVLYAPDVYLSFDNVTESLQCSANGNPTDYTFEITQTLGGKIIKRWRNETVGQEMTVDLTPFGMDRTGLYVCGVNNGIGETRSSNIYIRANTEPILDYYMHNRMAFEATLQGKGVLRVIFYAHPTYTSLSWSKMEANESAEKPLYHYEEPAEVLLYVDGVLTRVTGTRSTLFFSHVTPEDTGLYNFTVENDEGEASLQVTLALRNSRLDVLPPFLASRRFQIIILTLFGSILGAAALVFGCIALLKMFGLSIKVAKRRKDRLWWPMKRLSSIYYTWSGNPPAKNQLDDTDNADPVYYRGPLNSRFRLSTRRKPINSVLSDLDPKSPTLPPVCTLEMSFRRAAKVEDNNDGQAKENERQERGRESRGRDESGREDKRREEKETEESDVFAAPPTPCIGGYYAREYSYITTGQTVADE